MVFLRQLYKIPPLIWGSYDDRVYAVKKNSEKIYGVDPDSNVLIMPGFWGLPALDFSGKNNHGANHGTTYDGRLRFDGANDYIEIPTSASLDTLDDATLSVLVRFDDIISCENVLFGPNKTATDRVQLKKVDDYLRIYNDIDDIGTGANSAPFISTDTWYSITLVVTGTVWKAYSDNAVERISHDFEKDFSNLDNGFEILIGTNRYGAVPFSYWMKGAMRKIHIFNIALTTDQIALFHDLPYGLYQPVSRPVYFFQAAGVTLTVAELTGAGILDSFGLTQKHAITVQELLSGGSLDNIVLTQKHLLALQELLSSGALDSIVLIQKHLLTVQEMAGAGALDNVSLTQKHILAIQELLSPGAIDNIDLIAAILLVVAELISSSTLDNIDLTQKHILAIQEMLGEATLDSINLTQKHLLAVQELLSSGTLDNIELSLAILLVVADLLSSGALDTKSLTQKHNITVQELLSSGSLDVSTLTQKHILAVQELLSIGTLDALNLIAATLLVVADLVSSGALDSNVLTQKHILTVQEVLSTGLLDGAALTQKQLLAIQDLLSSGLIDSINFDIATGLICIALSKSTEYNIALSKSTEYNIALSKSTEYNIALSHKGGGVC